MRLVRDFKALPTFPCHNALVGRRTSRTIVRMKR